MKSIVIIGAGFGGLAAAAELSRSGWDVTVLEAHVYPGGCAGTFYHKGYRFDAGATLPAGFYPGGPMDLVAQAVGIDRWPVRRDDPAVLGQGGTREQEQDPLDREAVPMLPRDQVVDQRIREQRDEKGGRVGSG